ncbi:MAG: hypothetical protein E7456_00480 [Ruminococcaceae bacterium]|nr:hypothetical protein [Oscillospiraceae bacterium]
MANFDFSKIKKTANKVADKTVLFAKKASDKAVEYAKVTKLNAEIVSEKDKMRKAYQEIGQIYYKLHKDAVEAEYAEPAAALEAAINSIKAKRAEIEELKAANKDMSVEVEDVEIPEEIEAEPVEEIFVEEDSIPETEEAVVEEDIFADIETEDSIPETEEAPIDAE